MANPLNTLADYAQGLLSGKRSQELQESVTRALKSLQSEWNPRGDVIGPANPMAPTGPTTPTWRQLDPPPATQTPPGVLQEPDIAVAPGGGMVPPGVLQNIQSRLPEAPTPQGVWDPAIEAVNRRSAEEAQRLLRGEQELANIAASAAAEKEAARAAKDAPGYVDGLLSRLGLGPKAPAPQVRVAPPEGFDEAQAAAKFREEQLMSGRTDNLRGQDPALNEFKRGLVRERQEKAALGYVDRAQELERQQRLAEQVASGVEGLKTAGKMGGVLAAGVAAPAVVAGMANAPSPMAPAPRKPQTTADLASAVPEIAATPDEPPEPAPAMAPVPPAAQPNYMAGNPGSTATPVQAKSQEALVDEGLKFFGADTRPEITPEQRAKAEENFRANQDLQNFTNRWAGSRAVQEAVDRVLGPTKAQSDEEDRRVAAMASDQDLAHMEAVQRQEESNRRMQAMAQGVSKPQAPRQQAQMDVLPSDNLASVEQELTPEPMLKSKPKPLATASAYDDPTGTRFNQLIQRLANKTGMTPKEARAIYEENTAKGLSPRQAMQPLIDMGQTASMSRQDKLKGNVARGAALSPKNPRAATNALGELSQEDRDYAMAMQTTGGKAGPSPRELAAQKQKTDAEILLAEKQAQIAAEQGRLERESEERTAGITAGGHVSAAWPSALMTGAGIAANFLSDRFRAAAASENLDKTIAAEDERQKRALDAGQRPPPPTGEDDKKRAEARIMEQAADDSQKASKFEKMDQLYHGVPGGTEAILANQFRTGAGQAALQALTAQARKASKAYYGHDENSAAAMDDALKGMGMTDQVLRQKLVQEHTGVRPMRVRTS